MDRRFAYAGDSATVCVGAFQSGGSSMFRVVRMALAAALISVAVFSTGTASAATQPITITVKCYATPEKTIIKNVSSSSLKVKNFGSTYQAYAGEPIAVNKTLAPGQSVTFKTG